ncbi:hypothetical protein B0H14DRAFT_2787613 [Mycena olivaceomarginata]|nr:hypothetical protein B0H14DRAFT_2787613 [Mycena olivaceomarginata]
MATRHIVAMLLPAWGHTIGYLNATIQMLSKDSSLVITIVQHNLVAPKTTAELAGRSHDKTRLRVVGVGDTRLDLGPATLKVATEQLVSGWIENIARMAQGSEGWPKPRSIHFDFACGGLVVEATKKIVGPACKTLLWWSSLVVSMPANLSNYDFVAIAHEIYADESRRSGRSLDDVLQQVAEAGNGTDKLSGLTLKCPGGPDMYDHEAHAYASGRPLSAAMLTQAQTLTRAVDGYIVPSSTVLEPVGVPFCRELYVKRGQEVFTIGTQTVKAFLDSAVREYGPKSVLYISFGSVFFPVKTPRLVEALIDVLLNLELPFPFISHSEHRWRHSLPPSSSACTKVGRDSSQICDFWVEQAALLQHGAVGWFLTHGGFNSVSESLTQGIPLIIWPVAAEQPVNAGLLSAEPNAVAIELFQVRTGPQLGPSLRSDAKITGTVLAASDEFKAAFTAARGSRGALLQANAGWMARALREAHTTEGAEELVRLTEF